MRIGLVARSNRKGLGTMTAEFHQHMAPARTLVVRLPADEGGYPFEGDTRVVDFDGALPEDAMDWLIAGSDVIYSAETPYDYRLLERASAAGVRTVLHGMWEFLAYRHQRDLPRPTIFAAPSPWHLAEWPTPVAHLAVPLPDLEHRKPRFPVETLVHPGGSPARGDRNGTQALLEALPFVRRAMRIVLRTWSPPRRRRLPSRIDLVIKPSAPDWREVTADADAIVIPRRYGGLCLPIQEATARHLPVLALAREREAGYPHAAHVPIARSRPMGLPCGPVERADVDPRLLARSIDHLVADREMAEEMAEASATFARQRSWEALRPAYEAVLAP